MNREAVEKIAGAVLYEGYLLYPYRASSIKNKQRFNFGVLYPEGFDTSAQVTECLVRSEQSAKVDVTVRYLRIDAEQRAHERAIDLCGLSIGALTESPRANSDDIGEVRVTSARIDGSHHRLTIETRNTNQEAENADRSSVLLKSMISAHTILSVTGGSFLSLLDPPPELNDAARACRNIGTWPVLVGDEGSHDAMLSSPIILYDYPQIAPESPQNLFDGTEIDEILTLRIMTLTDAEKEEIRGGDERARTILEKADNLPAGQLMKLHGALRGLPPKKSASAFGVDLRKGDRVRLWPQKSADIMDIALKGKTATIEAIEEDFDGQIHLAVLIDDDPGRDLGELRQPGHRFFFGLDEVEPLALFASEGAASEGAASEGAASEGAASEGAEG